MNQFFEALKVAEAKYEQAKVELAARMMQAELQTKEAEAIKAAAAELTRRRAKLAEDKAALKEPLKAAKAAIKVALKALEKAQRDAQRAREAAQKQRDAKAKAEAKAKADAEAKARAKAKTNTGAGQKAGHGSIPTEVMADLARNYGLRSNLNMREYNDILRKYMAANHPDKFAATGNQAQIDLQTAKCQWASQIINQYRRASTNCRAAA